MKLRPDITHDICNGHPICEPSGWLATGESKIDAIWLCVGLGKGHEVVIVACINKGVSKDEESRRLCCR